jgi:hypothetical protein
MHYAGPCCRSAAEIVGLNPTVGMDVCLSSRGVLPTVMRHWLWSRNLVNEEALAHWGLLRQIKKMHYAKDECFNY